ncbi:MAG: hypothetical protein P4M01_02285 [Acidobacteriota bacterium]|nr:hypothetical protein [Acidobacteriota bacterium]
MIPTQQALETLHVVVTRKDGGTVKGRFADGATLLLLLRGELPSEGRFVLLAENEAHEIEWSTVKAIFFVKDPAGDRKRRNVRFYGAAPDVHRVWVELTFLDGEVLEGYVENPLRGLNDPGFFLEPTSPGENNRAIFVNKQSLAGLRVLGVDLQK